MKGILCTIAPVTAMQGLFIFERSKRQSVEFSSGIA
jgi:hypothetical protein